MVDWSKAPEGATHYRGAEGEHSPWHRHDHTGNWFFGESGAWIELFNDFDYWNTEDDMMIARPTFEPITSTPRIAAHEFLERGVNHMRDRAVQRDSDAGERSMARAVAAFNAQEGTNLTEVQGWRFMIQLKYARAVNGVFVADDYEDMAAYVGLAGEAAQSQLDPRDQMTETLNFRAKDNLPTLKEWINEGK